jgi:phenylacetate-CoA ligase
MRKRMNQLLNKYGFLLNFLPTRLVFGKTYKAAEKLEKDYNRSESKHAFVQAYQEKMLNEIINYARKNTRYYQDYSNDLEKNGFIDKDTVLAHSDKLLVSKSGADYITTGGTSGKTLGFYINKNRKGAEWYYMTSHWARVGFNVKNSYRAVLRNHVLADTDVLVHNSFLREFQFSNYNLNEQKLEGIVRELKRLKPEFIHAYPSAAYILCKYLKSNNIELPFIKAFLSGSENVYDHHRQLVENELGYRFFTWYGHSEKLILAAECEKSNYYHSNPFYGYMELIDKDGNRIDKAGEFGEIVGTGFINTAMPFIRYRTGDYAEYVGEMCEHCGRVGLVFKNVKGRWDGEMVYSKSKTPVSTTALNMHNDLYENIKELQFYQKNLGILIVRIVPELGFNEHDEAKIISELTAKLGRDFKVEVELVKVIQHTKNNKYKLLIQNIKQSELNYL